eukprot:9488135-Pyramimonas_sp.AAC.1
MKLIVRDDGFSAVGIFLPPSCEGGSCHAIAKWSGLEDLVKSSNGLHTSGVGLGSCSCSLGGFSRREEVVTLQTSPVL